MLTIISDRMLAKIYTSFGIISVSAILHLSPVLVMYTFFTSLYSSQDRFSVKNENESQFVSLIVSFLVTSFEFNIMLFFCLLFFSQHHIQIS